MTKIPIEDSRDVLIIVDLQNDFCPGGALAVTDGDAVVSVANSLMDRFRHVVLTQDWHPVAHSSFASVHPGKHPFESVEMSYGSQTLWPDHCVEGSPGAAFHADLHTDRADLVIRKGRNPAIDPYSAFYENDRTTPTGLSGYLSARSLTRLFLVGLATDFCVYFSAMDARREGFDVVLIEDGCRAIDLDGSCAAAMVTMRDSGVRFSASDDIVA
jgi:nicotinamidase/pyrazinamidase